MPRCLSRRPVHVRGRLRRRRRVGRQDGWPSNKPVEPTPNSLHSSLAPAIGRGSPLAFGVAIHGVTSASPRESAEFPTDVKEVVAMFGVCTCDPWHGLFL